MGDQGVDGHSAGCTLGLSAVGRVAMQAVTPVRMAAWLCSKGQSCSMCVLRGGVLGIVGFCESRKRLLHTGKVAKVNVQGSCTTKKHTVGCCYSCNCSSMHPFSTRGIIVVCAFHVACYCFPGFAYSCQQRRKCQAYGPEHCNMSFTVLQTTWALCQGCCACADCTLHHLMLLACSASSVCNSCSPAAMLRPTSIGNSWHIMRPVVAKYLQLSFWLAVEVVRQRRCSLSCTQAEVRPIADSSVLPSPPAV